MTPPNTATPSVDQVKPSETALGIPGAGEISISEPAQLAKPDPLRGFAIGRIVHYVLEGTGSRPETRGRVRPAIIVNEWPEMQEAHPGYANLLVFTDARNDGFAQAECVQWVTSRVYNEAHEPGTWHWPQLIRADRPAPDPAATAETK